MGWREPVEQLGWRVRALGPVQFLERHLLLPSRPPGRAPNPQQSDAIIVARVLCIVGMVYAHAWTGRTGAYLVENADTAQGVLRWLLVEMLGRSAVPLLGMVSGWLVAGGLMRSGYLSFVQGKLRTIVMPLLLWNALAVLLVSGAAWMGWLRAPIPASWWELADEVGCLATFNHINVQTPFLRDLFVCLLLAPLVIRLRSGWLLFLIAIVAGWAITGRWFPLILRPQIALFFLIGIAARRWLWAERVAWMPMAYAALPFALLAPAKTAVAIWGFWFAHENAEIVTTLEIATRLSAALLMWRLAIGLSAGSFAEVARRLEPYMFLLFCSHMIMIWLVGSQLGKLPGPLGSPGYPLYLVAQPFLALSATIALGKLLQSTAPRAARVLSGGRLGGKQPERRPNATAGAMVSTN